MRRVFALALLFVVALSVGQSVEAAAGPIYKWSNVWIVGPREKGLECKVGGDWYFGWQSGANEVWCRVGGSCVTLYNYNETCPDKMEVGSCGEYVACVTGACPSGTQLMESTGLCYPACPEGQSRDPVTHNCVAPPCPTGAYIAGWADTSGSQCNGGCTYNWYTGIVSAGGRFDAKWVSTGGTCAGADTIENDASTNCNQEMSAVLRGIYCSDLPDCASDQVRGPDGSCVALDMNNCVDYGGELVCAQADQNCVIVGGQRICTETPDADPDDPAKAADYCYKNAAGMTICFDDGYKKTETSTTERVTDPNTGNTTVTTTSTTINNTTGLTQTTTTSVVYDPDGNEISRSSSTETQGEGDQGEGDFIGQGAGTGPALELPELALAQAALSDAWAQVEAAPVVAALSGSAGDVPVGSCPTFSMTLPVWGTVSTDLHCTTWDSVKGALEVVMLALWTIVGVLIIASA